MSDVVLTDIEQFSPSLLNNGTYLTLLYADQIPPHLGVISQGKYYSLTSHESQVALDVQPIWRTIQAKTIGTLFIGLKGAGSTELLDEIFGQYEKVIPGKLTCLAPLKDYFRLHHKLTVDDINFVFHLVKQLKIHNLIQTVYQLNLEEQMDGRSFTLLEYTIEDIYQRIEALQNGPVNA